MTKFGWYVPGGDGKGSKGSREGGEDREAGEVKQ